MYSFSGFFTGKLTTTKKVSFSVKTRKAYSKPCHVQIKHEQVFDQPC
ncbi:hypothetical protein H744_2c0082 [Photobacterium gaetbulicola Gung47]|uniref:Uncharacterized protein n=1 Tax=Photobacterium gaetbulicola Gung47 TaxID=658445 RepID=A0A0C5WP63_9GAMM|nr:hypothetical protein H744_2c0082 [Photobacterium gaetbulicola Gung47]